MTDEVMALRGLIEKSADADIPRAMIGFAAQRLMELTVGGLTGAAHGKKSPGRFPQGAPHQAALQQSRRAAQRRDQAPH